MPRGPTAGHRKRRPCYTSARGWREHRALRKPRLFAAAYVLILCSVWYLVDIKPLLFHLDTESGEFAVQRGLIVHIGLRLSPRRKKRPQGTTRGIACKGRRFNRYINKLIPATALKNLPLINI